MKRVFFIDTATGTRRLNETDFPLSVGGDGSDIVFGERPVGSVVAHIALSSGHAYIQPANPDIELFHNHEYINTSAWLKSGDRVQLGDRVLCWDVKGDQVFVKVRPIEDTHELQPPPVPPPDDEDGQDTQVIPIVTATVSPARYRRLRKLAITVFAVLSLVALFVLFATPMEVSVSPGADKLSVTGFPPPVPMGRKKLVVPGSYTVRATRQGYQPLEQEIEVPSGDFQSFHFVLKELPGRLQIRVDPVVPVRVTVEGAGMQVDADNIVLLERGTRRLTIETDRYLAETLELEIRGFGTLQEHTISLRPAWARVQLESEPAGATVSVDGETLGLTPLLAEIVQGERTIELSLQGYKTARLSTEVVAGTRPLLDIFRLVPNDGSLVLASHPEGATVSVSGKFYGETPVSLVLASGISHQLRLSRPGYQTLEKKISLRPDEEQHLRVEMTPEHGIVFTSSKPADASLAVDGLAAGSGTQRLRLTTRPHELTFSKAGYLSQTVKVTPRVDTSQNVDIALKTLSQVKTEARPVVLRTAGGQDMRLLEPKGSFQMGASRREAGRRANESQRLVEITRPFYLSVNEVSNAEYRLFVAGHNSGSAEGVSLNSDRQPVVNVSWDDAARYCNWLSGKDGLTPAYVETGGRMERLPGANNGYRLPTEAEWVYAARVAGRGEAARYPWGDGYPPGAITGNFADAQIADTLANVVTGYNDGYRVSAPVGSFTAQPPGFHDLGGNVAEWINDFYAVYPGQSEQLVKDPAGPSDGDHHVVRGSSWRDGSITELRLSYRDYSRGSRDNLGFRIARYADE